MHAPSITIDNKALNIYKKFMIQTEFILSNNLEDKYVDFLNTLKFDSAWLEFHQEINETMQEYEITEEEIQATMKQLFIL
ncbi:hypothetical protein V7138_15090 [Bacillus sp. JJ1533]|uniref:hypothetical protein n=1 Tax=Bacillus sp. JJ1533 TaxID=3122959 RepID=UPI002FFFA31A